MRWPQGDALKPCFFVLIVGIMSMQVAERIGALEAELRRSKRREEKLAALQYRLREDLKQNQGDIRWTFPKTAVPILLSCMMLICLRWHC